MAIVAGCLVFSRNKSNRTVLQGNLADKVTAKFLTQFQQSKLKQDLETERTAAKVFSRFGGSFHDGVGTNTWKGTPWAKYDDKDTRTESLKYTSGDKHLAKLRARRGTTMMLHQEKGNGFNIPAAQALQSLHESNLARGWKDVDITTESMKQLYRSIDKQLEPLAEAYPHLRAIRH
ncbi:hypothetical protein GUITHDRAFT_111710 [Guillardia theta CCMP2712]|uniref:Uncharacterized protein n=1 Tax=Guillardia theta (strain CCMP2712) TaxID=905079 RepID=L1J220_GUITC|nr:hypothetical protein GUITHDRAFT_111710 [Guillardia theta CCMP2712]EKX42140.1 hypothetical protein GUITHDRAFT_111710 [Guillardia theta CCMP2712]|eukprot:XP_005829120.1 hypothetical protein GUITHDRAFT_111710 [Guillardia theta CCMP2712]